MAEIIDDIFQDSNQTIVDCDILEAAKENVQPLASGRRVTSLSAILATPHAAREAKLSATRNRLRINVELALEDPEDDPLEAYCRFVYWTVDNYPQGQSAESGLLELIEEATRVLKDDRDGIWRGELKYLKLWVLYASFVEKPNVVYKFMLVNDIGTNHALFYEEYALVLERDGRRNAADEIYMLGVARQAEPLDRLHLRYREFQKRMMTAAPLPSAPTPPPATVPAPKRVALRTTSVSPSTPAPRPPPAPSSSRPNGRLQVFVDPTDEAPEAAEGNAWSDLGTRKTRVKENVRETQKMGGTKIKQAGKTQRMAVAHAPAPTIPPAKAKGKGKEGKPSSKGGFVPFKDDEPSAPPKADSKGKFVPFKDDECQALPQTPAKPSFVPFKDDDSGGSFTPFRDEPASTTRATAPDTVMKVKKAGPEGSSTSSEAEALRRDPLKNYGSAIDLGDE
ncbi:Mitotic spindle checkpoint component mad3 [Pleurotus pulmonarius]|nr:Mitotic spindle checkpoint component mad3 [Pleurotus pulmonarius]